MPPEFGGKWATECLNTRLPTLMTQRETDKKKQRNENFSGDFGVANKSDNKAKCGFKFHQPIHNYSKIRLKLRERLLNAEKMRETKNKNKNNIRR